MPNGRDGHRGRRPAFQVGRARAGARAGKLTLVRQYRYAVNAFLWELPAGSVDEGESPEEAARRECHEEIGLVPSTDRPAWPRCIRRRATATRRCSSSGSPAWRRPTSRRAVDEDEDIEVQVFDLRDVREMVRRGEIHDMKTIVALSLL